MKFSKKQIEYIRAEFSRAKKVASTLHNQDNDINSIYPYLCGCFESVIEDLCNCSYDEL